MFTKEEQELLGRMRSQRDKWKPANSEEQALAEKILAELVERSTSKTNDPNDTVQAATILFELTYGPPNEIGSDD